MMFSALPASPPFFFRDRYSGNEASSLGFSNISARGGEGGAQANIFRPDGSSHGSVNFALIR